jgi:hypothetical protein
VGPGHEPRYTSRVSDDDPEIEYLRAVEELFTTLRGAPHILSPKDIQLARRWWRDGVPLPAVGGGIGEVLDRRRQTGEADPVVSLSYCRHAVRRAAKRMAEHRVGLATQAADEASFAAERPLADLAATLIRAADGCRDTRPAAAVVIDTVAAQVAAVAGEAREAAEEQLFTLENALLEGCRRSLSTADRRRLDDEAAAAVAASGATGAAADRALRAFSDQALRRLLGLPRLEIP